MDPQSSVYTGDTVTLSCETAQSTGWEIYWWKDSQHLKHLANLDTISVTESDPGEAEYQLARDRVAFAVLPCHLP